MPPRSKPSFLLSLVLASLSGVLLTLSFPDFELWYLAWVGFIPFFYALWTLRNSTFATIVAGWICGTVFIYGTCWWLTFAPINYAGFPPALAYSIMLFVAIGVGVFFSLFAFIQGRLFRRYGAKAVMLAPVIWIGVEYLRFLLTGNAWNAIGYSQAFVPTLIQPAKYGSFFLVGFLIVAINAIIFLLMIERTRKTMIVSAATLVLVAGLLWLSQHPEPCCRQTLPKTEAVVVALQPNVPMAGLDETKWMRLRQIQADTAEDVLEKARLDDAPEVIVLPESPMNYMYDRDPDFRDFLRVYTRRVNASVLFNSAEPSSDGKGLHNSAVMVGETGNKVGQYNKIHLMPFGEYVPMSDVLSQVMPPLLGSYRFGEETNLLPFGEAKAGIMICFESHFPSLSRAFVQNGADVLVEMTNDGYLGPTPVLKQHLASAVFRAVETDRPLLRVTNVGISGYITPAGRIRDETKSYVEDTRVWNVYKSDGSQTVYVKYGDWFAILCATLSLIFFVLTFGRAKYAAKETGN